MLGLTHCGRLTRNALVLRPGVGRRDALHRGLRRLDGAHLAARRRGRRRQKQKTVEAAAAHVGGVSSVSWAGGARYALSSGNDGAVVLWDADAPNDEGEGAPLQRYAAHADACWSVHSPTSSDSLGGGRVFATGGADRTCRLFSTDRTRP